jgi:glycosyltransferase involved in cell wall biosynthesis
MNINLTMVTGITPADKRVDYLTEIVESVLSQDYPNIQYFVLDNDSKDNTNEVMEKYRERVTCETHQGPAGLASDFEEKQPLR